MTDGAAERRWLRKSDFQQLLDRLIERGYEVIGPTVGAQSGDPPTGGAIVYDRLRTAEELPRGWTERQEPGRYRLERRADEAWFGFTVGPHSWKKYLFPPTETILTSQRSGDGWEMRSADEAPPWRAFLGVRACELAAIRVQDRVFLGGPYVDPHYQARRERIFVIAVQCTQAAPTCFCSSMGTGPECSAGYDLALTELEDGFELLVGTPAGAELAAELPLTAAAPEQVDVAAARRAEAERQIERRFDTHGIRDLLLERLDHPHWDDVAARCLSCANCTLVCPTCFCSSVAEVTDLTGDEVRRERRWDSCFQLDLTFVNGQAARPTVRSRYRQWLTHKLATWHDQFGESGCVGCGRCVTWCPVGIDLTVEVEALRGGPAPVREAGP